MKLTLKRKQDMLLRLANVASWAQLVLCIAIFGGCAVFEVLPTEVSDQKTDKKLVFNIVPESPEASDANLSEYSAKMNSHHLPVPKLEVTAEVRRELDYYLRNNAKCIDDGISRQERLMPVLDRVLEDEGLPNEILNLALIESNFRPESVSPAGAAGLWQFMAGTARNYGLKVSPKVDERKDPILSTVAVSRYLKNLYARYGDWYLALAAYNSGDGVVSKAISRTNSKDYWTISRKGALPDETSRFVPKFIAASILQKLRFRYGANVQLASYLERHIVTVTASAGSRETFAFNIDSAGISSMKG